MFFNGNNPYIILKRIEVVSLDLFNAHVYIVFPSISYPSNTRSNGALNETSYYFFKWLVIVPSSQVTL